MEVDLQGLNNRKKNSKMMAVIIGVIAVCLLAGVLIFIEISHDKGHIEKYSAKLTISAKSSDDIETVYLTIKDDGRNASIISNKLLDTGYIIDKELYYIKDNVYYIHNSDATYRDFFPSLNKIKNLDLVREEGEYSYYSKVLSQKEMNELLKSLYFGKEVSSSCVVEIIKMDDFLVGFDLSLNNIEGYENVDIRATFDELEDNFTIDTSLALGKNDDVFGTKYEYEHTDKNIYEIVK